MDLSALIENKRKTLPVEISFSVEELEKEKEVKYISPLCINGIIRDTGKHFEFNASIKTDTEFYCSRCLKSVEVPIDLSINTILVKEDESSWDDEFDSFVIDNNSVDLISIASYEILQYLPMQILCEDDCEGLCSGCGANLNYEECNCQEEYTDSRFDILKQLME